MNQQLRIHLKTNASEMAQEEILKLMVFLSRNISKPRFDSSGTVLECEAPREQSEELSREIEDLATRVLRGLRGLQRKVLFRSPTADRPVFRGDGNIEGIHLLGTGQVALQGTPLRLFQYFDRVLEEFGDPWTAIPVSVPALIPAQVLAKCDYFRSFPHAVTFACHLPQDASAVADFRVRHLSRDDLDDAVPSHLAVPEACLSPAACYHVYHLNRARVIPPSGLIYGICGKCFRFEAGNMQGLDRLWEFTMREVVFLGSRQNVLAHRQTSIEMMSRFLEEHQLAGEIRTASDPFFIAPDALVKTYYQLSSETKYEISLFLSDNGRIAVGSHNYHNDFFGRAFDVRLEGGGPMHSACVAFGLERWVHAFVVQHGHKPDNWPNVVRRAPEFDDCG